MTEHWVAWVMLLLLCLPMIALLFQPMMISTSFRTLLTVKERDSIFIATSPDPRAEACMVTYGVGVAAMLLYALYFTGQGFSPWVWLMLVGVVVAIRLVHLALMWMVAYAFFEHSNTDVFRRHYRYLTTCVVVLMYPLSLLALYCPDLPEPWLFGVLALIALFYVGVLIGKTCALFMNGIKTVLYALLYVVTLEVLPAALMIGLAHGIVCR